MFPYYAAASRFLAVASPIVTQGLVINLDNAPSSGTTWTDLAGNYNGTLVNGPTYSTAGSGSILFDGTNDHVVAGPVPLTGIGTVSVTWAAWVRPSAAAGNIIAMSPSNPMTGWNLPIISATSQRFRGRIYNNNMLTAISTYTLNTWYYVGMIFDYAAGTQRLNVNGVLQASQSGITYGGSGANNFIFLAQASAGIDNTGMFAGNIAAVHLYTNKALSDAEMAQNFNAQRARFGYT